MQWLIHSQLKSFLFFLSFLLLGTFASCDPISNLTDAEHVATAKDFLDKGDINASIIELKNALQKNPENAEARTLLGRNYITLENGQAAEKELRHARNLGVVQEALLLLIADALQLQGKNQEILDEIIVPVSFSPQDQARLRAYRGDAWLAMDKAEKANVEYEMSLTADPTSPFGKLGLARLAAADKETKRALQLLDEALEVAPEEPKIWSFQADLYASARDAEKAEASYGKAIRYQTRNQVDRAKRALIRIELKDHEGADKDIQVLKKQAPKFFLTHYARGLLAFKQGKFPEAQTALDESLKLNSEYLPANYYLGFSHLKQNHFSQAEYNLKRHVRAVPHANEARRALAFARFRLGNFEGAKTALLPVIQKLPNDARSLELLGKIELGLGDKEQSLEHMKKATYLQPDSAATHMELGRHLLGQGESEQGLKELETAIELDPELQQAEILLVVNYLKAKKYDEAMEAAKRLSEKHPNSSTPPTLMAGAYLGRGNLDKARNLLIKALAINPADTNAAINLAGIEIANENLSKAESHYRQALDYRPNNLRILMKLAELEQKKGDTIASKEWLEQAMEQNPKALAPRVYLGDYYLRKGQPTKTLSIVLNLQDLYPNSHTLAALIGQAQLLSGDRANAVRTFKKLVELQSHSAHAHYLLSKAYVENRQLAKAKEALDKALILNPDHMTAKLVKTRLMTIEGKQKEADVLFGDLQKTIPEIPEIFELKAWMALQRNEPRKAITVYKDAQQRFPDFNYWPLRLSQTQWAIGDRNASFLTLQRWLSAHPDDFQVRYVMANNYLLLNQLDKAHLAFTRLNEQAPENVLVLNNLAWLSRDSDLTKALSYAERAHKLASEWPEAMDTLAMILLKKGEVDRAVGLLKDAAAKSPEQLQIRYHLAVALVQSGNKSAAKKILTGLVREDAPFGERKAAGDLLHKIKGGLN